MSQQMKASKKCINFMKSYETLHDGDLSVIGLQPKQDASGIYTIGYGHAIVHDGVFLTDKITNVKELLKHYTLIDEAEAEALFVKDLARFERLVNNKLKVTVTQPQFDALVSHAFNCGISSGLYKAVNSKNDPHYNEQSVRDRFINYYITAGGVYMKGLKRRRVDEFEMFHFGDYNRDYETDLVTLRQKKK